MNAGDLSSSSTSLGNSVPTWPARQAWHSWPWPASREITRRRAEPAGLPHPCQARAPGRTTQTWTLDLRSWVSVASGECPCLVYTRTPGWSSTCDAVSYVAPLLHQTHQYSCLPMLGLQISCQPPGQCAWWCLKVLVPTLAARSRASRSVGGMPGPVLGRPIVIPSIISNGYTEAPPCWSLYAVQY